MKKNVGGIDKTLRIILGIVLVLAGLFAPVEKSVRTLIFFMAAIAVFTGVSGI